MGTGTGTGIGIGTGTGTGGTGTGMRRALVGYWYRAFQLPRVIIYIESL